MIRILICLILLGGAAMAKDGGVQAPRGTAPIDQDEQFWATEQGQDIERLFNDFSAGKKSYDQAYDEYHKKWGGRTTEKPAAQVPNSTPYLPIR